MVSKIFNRCLVAALLLLVPKTYAGDLSGLGGAFVDVGVGAGPMGLAGSNIVLGKDVYAIVSNPAGITRVAYPQAAFSMTKQFSLIPYNLALYAQRLGDDTGVGAGFLTSGDEALRENTVYLAYARRFSEKMSLGVNLKYRNASFGSNAEGAWVFEGGNRQVQGSANGFGIDFGVIGLLGQRMGYALVLKDLLSEVSYDAENETNTASGGSEAIAPALKFGFGYVASRSLSIEFNLEKATSRSAADRLSIGMQQTFLSFLTVRGGISQRLDGAERNRQYSFGGSLNQGLSKLRMTVDFAYLITDIDNFFHIGLRLGWQKNSQ